MRTYLSMSNFIKALMLGTVVTLMSIPRMIQGGFRLDLYIPAALVCMTLVSGAATAWSGQGGMAGLFPDRRRMAVGAGIAVLLSLMAMPLEHFWIVPPVRHAIAETGNARLMALRYPETPGGCVALMLWSAGFETMFFQAATMSFFVRLARRPWMGVVFAVSFRLFVTAHQISLAGVGNAIPLILVMAAVGTAMLCVLFIRTGLLPAMILAAGFHLHLFVKWWT
jgi:hypothetical protein